MHFLIINHYATTPSYNGGTRHYDLARELIKRGNNVTIVASSFNHFMKEETKKYNCNSYIQENIDGIDFVWIQTIPYKKSLKRILNMFSFYKNATLALNKRNCIKSPDIVIGSSVHLLAAQLGLQIARKYNAKFFFEERDLWPQTFIDFGKISSKNLIAKILFKYEKYFYKNAEKIIVLFPKAVEYVKSKGIEEGKVIYLPNGYSHYLEPKEISNPLLLDCLTGNTMTYIGSHGIANELDSILDLAKICKDIDLNFLMIGEGKEKNRLIDRKIKENINNITFIDSINKNQVQTVLEKSTFSVISIKDSPLYKYGFSMNKIFDYFKAANPIFMITSPLLAKDYISDGVHVSLDLLYHKKKIIYYLENKEAYNNDRLKIKENSKKHDWEHLTQYLVKNI